MSNIAGREPDLTVKDVAQLLQLHPETVRIMARSGDFPNAYKTGSGARGSAIRIPWSDVQDFRRLQPRASQ